MDIYSFSLDIYEEIKAESLEEAWKIARDRVRDGYYGPTQANLAFLEEIPEPAKEEVVGF